MQVVRTIVWMLLLFSILVFSWANWDENVTVRIWSGMFWETKLPAVIIVSFMIGFIPMWILQRGTTWRLNRRIANLENAVRSAATTPAASGTSEVHSEPAVVEETPAPAEPMRDTDPPRDLDRPTL